MRASHFAFFMNLPTLLCLGLVLAYPVIYAAYLSVHRVGLAQLRRGEFPFNGWENYSRVLEDALFDMTIPRDLTVAGLSADQLKPGLGEEEAAKLTIVPRDGIGAVKFGMSPLCGPSGFCRPCFFISGLKCPPAVVNPGASHLAV